MSVYPYFNRMLCVRFFFTLLYTKLTVLCYRWKTITTINHPVMSRTEINLIINFLLFNAKCIHSLQNICTRYYSLYIFASSWFQQNAAQTIQTLWHAPGMAIHTLPFILPLHVSRRLTGHKHEWVSLTQRLLPDFPYYREILPVTSYYWSWCCWWWWASWSRAPSIPG